MAESTTTSNANDSIKITAKNMRKLLALISDKYAVKSTTLAGYGITDAATSEQGKKADTAIQTITVNGVVQTKTNGTVEISAVGGGDANVQSDWNETNETSDAYIQNKPTSMPASDVYDWAKLPTKPSYSKSDVGLGNVDNTADADKEVKYAETAGNAGTVNGKTVETNVPENAVFTDTVYTHPTSGVSAGTYKSVTVDDKGHVTGGTNPTTLAGYGITDAASKTHNHNDTYYTESEIDTKLNAKLDTSLKGVSNGLAELDSTGRVPSSQLPSYVDDVLEYDSISKFPVTGETGKIYLDDATNLTYRWSGSGYIEISPSLALGETSSTAYRGDRGKIAYDHSQTAHAPSDAEKNVQSDWSVTDTSSDAYIKNKPTTLSGYGITDAAAKSHTHDDRYYTESEIDTKLNAKMDSSDIVSASLSIPTSAWAADTTYSAYGYKATVANSSITSADTVSITLSVASLAIAEAAYLSAGGETYNGGLYLYAKSVPKAALSGSMVIIKG